MIGQAVHKSEIWTNVLSGYKWPMNGSWAGVFQTHGHRANAIRTVKKRRRSPAGYILSGAVTPMRLRVSANTRRQASQAARRALETPSSTGRPSLGSTWQTV